jgi:hypothetical protein
LPLLLGYATSQEKLSRGEIDSFLIGLTRAKAAELGRALLERSGMDPRSAGAKQTSIERTPMRTEDIYSGAVPMVVKLDIGMTEPEGVALEITYAQTRERFEAGQFDRAMYVMTIPMANELLSILQTEMTGKGAQKH